MMKRQSPKTHSLHHVWTIHTLHWLTTSLTYNVQIAFPKTSSAAKTKSLICLPPWPQPSPMTTSARMLKTTAASIAPSVTALFYLPLQLGRILRKWKGSRVVAILKVSAPKWPDNYCPISLLRVLSKAIERCMYNLIASHLEANPFLTPSGSLN